MGGANCASIYPYRATICAGNAFADSDVVKFYWDSIGDLSEGRRLSTFQTGRSTGN